MVFPEAALSGYFLEGGVAEAALTVEQLIDMLGPPPAGGPDVVIGFYERWRRRLHNSAVYLEAGDGDVGRATHASEDVSCPHTASLTRLGSCRDGRGDSGLRYAVRACGHHDLRGNVALAACYDPGAGWR